MWPLRIVATTNGAKAAEEKGTVVGGFQHQNRENQLYDLNAPSDDEAQSVGLLRQAAQKEAGWCEGIAVCWVSWPCCYLVGRNTPCRDQD